ncbi:MAG: DNA polymerase III subunit delta' [Desulfovibrio sp.]|nr:DNA polymerase III subunit delta' [Desulfovibrio sp.]
MCARKAAKPKESANFRVLHSAMEGLKPLLANPDYTHFTRRLLSLAPSPPQVLLIEGGTEEERRLIARLWSCAILCKEKNDNSPCLICPVCAAVLEDRHADILAYDGAVSKTEEDEHPSFFQAFNAEHARSLKEHLRSAPLGPYRFVYLTGIAQSRPEAPNALLKVLEEPQLSTLFVLLVPQREQILRTLVSRSFSITLPWPQSDPSCPDIEELTMSLALFLSNKDNFLGKISGKDVLTPQKAQIFLKSCQNSLVHVLSDMPHGPLEKAFVTLPKPALQYLINWLNEASMMVRSTISPVTPLRVLEAFAMRLYCLFNDGR